MRKIKLPLADSFSDHKTDPIKNDQLIFQIYFYEVILQNFCRTVFLSTALVIKIISVLNVPDFDKNSMQTSAKTDTAQGWIQDFS